MRSAKGIVTASMLYLGILMALSQGWIEKARSIVQTASGSG